MLNDDDLDKWASRKRHWLVIIT